MRYFLNKDITVRRLRRSNTNLSAYSATGTAFDASLQDPTPDRVQMAGGQIGKVYDIYVPDSNANIEAGDQVVIAGVKYSIRAKEVVDFGGNPYIALIGVKQDA